MSTSTDAASPKPPPPNWPDPYPVIEEVVRAYDVRWVIVTLREGGTSDPLGLWQGCAARDSTDNLGWTGGPDTTATWLACDPAFEAEGARPNLARTLREWGEALRAAGRTTDAEPILRRALGLFEELELAREAAAVRTELALGDTTITFD